MEKKYYDAPQMEIVKIQIGQSLLQASGNKEMGISNQSVSNGSALAGEFFGGDDSGEDW